MRRISLKINKTVVRYNGKVLSSRSDVFSKILELCNYFRLETVSLSYQNAFLKNWSYMRFDDLVKYLKILVSCYNAGITYLGKVDVTSLGVWLNGKYLMICQYNQELVSHTALLTSEEIEDISKECSVLVRPYSYFVDAAS